MKVETQIDKGLHRIYVDGERIKTVHDADEAKEIVEHIKAYINRYGCITGLEDYLIDVVEGF